MFHLRQTADGPFIGARGPFITPNPSVNVASTKPVLSSADDGTPTSDGTAGASVSTTVGNGTLYWAVVTDGGSATNQQIKQGSGGDIVVAGSQSVSGTGTQTVGEITGLVSETDYQILFLQTNSAGTDSAQASVDLTTDAVTLSAASDGTPTSDGATGAGVDTNTGNGVLYWAVVSDGSTPTDAQIKAGTGGGIVVADSQAVSTDGTQTIDPITGLESETVYQIIFLQTDQSGNDSTQASVELETTA